MKIHGSFNRRRTQTAFATAAVFILLTGASALMLTTAATFRQLHKELRFVERKQVQRWNRLATGPAGGAVATPAGTPSAATNSVPVEPRP